MSERKNIIARSPHNKILDNRSTYSANKQINSLIKNLARKTSYSYSLAIDRNRKNPLDELQRRVLKKLQPKLSRDRFVQLQNDLSSLCALDRHDCLQEMWSKLNAR